MKVKVFYSKNFITLDQMESKINDFLVSISHDYEVVFTNQSTAYSVKDDATRTVISIWYK